MNLDSLEDLAKVYSTTNLAELHQLARSCKPKVTEQLSGLSGEEKRLVLFNISYAWTWIPWKT